MRVVLVSRNFGCVASKRFLTSTTSVDFVNWFPVILNFSIVFSLVIAVLRLIFMMQYKNKIIYNFVKKSKKLLLSLFCSVAILRYILMFSYRVTYSFFTRKHEKITDIVTIVSSLSLGLSVAFRNFLVSNPSFFIVGTSIILLFFAINSVFRSIIALGRLLDSNNAEMLRQLLAQVEQHKQRSYNFVGTFYSHNVNPIMKYTRKESPLFTQLSTPRFSVQKIFYRTMKNRSNKGGKLTDSSVNSLEHKPTDFKDHRINPTFTKAHSFSTLAENDSSDTKVNTIKNSEHFSHNTALGKSLEQRIKKTHEFELNTEKARETALTIVETQNISNFTENTLCPVFMTKRQHHLFLMCVSLNECFNENPPITKNLSETKKPPVPDFMFYAIITRGNPGDNANIINQVFSKTLSSYGPQNLLVVLPPEALMNISKDTKGPLESVIHVRHYTTIFEIHIIHLINKEFKNDKIVFTKEKSYIGDSNYYNKSPNGRPDAFIDLYRKVCNGAISRKGIDVKMTGTSSFKYQDIIQSASPNTFAKSIMQATYNLRDQLDALLNEKELSSEDRAYAENILKEINNTVATYSNDLKVNSFALRHNVFHEAHSDFFTRHNIGINLQVCLSTESLNLDPAACDKFEETFRKNAFSPEADINKFFKSKELAYPEGSKISDKHFMELVFEFLEKVG